MGPKQGITRLCVFEPECRMYRHTVAVIDVRTNGRPFIHSSPACPSAARERSGVVMILRTAHKQSLQGRSIYSRPTAGVREARQSGSYAN